MFCYVPKKKKLIEHLLLKHDSQINTQILSEILMAKNIIASAVFLDPILVMGSIKSRFLPYAHTIILLEKE